MNKCKLTAYLISIIFCLSFFTACDEDLKTKKLDSNSEGTTWTVFMYLCGSDLESEGSAATLNLDELLQADLEDNVQFIIETGGAKSWSVPEIDPDKNQRFKVENGELTLLDEKASCNMGDKETLEDFLSWGLEKYSSDKNGLVFWNHGAGSIGGVAFDENYDYDSLTLPELKDAMKNSSEYMTKKLEFVGFDACLMSTIETANVFEPYANYLISSQEYEPGGGWAYDRWAQFIADNPGENGARVGKEICDSYYEKCKDEDTDEMCTLSVVDLSKIPNLIDSFNIIADDIYNVSKDPSEFAKLSRSASKAENYGGNSDAEGYTNLVDLGDLVNNIKGEIDDNSSEVLTSLDDAVIYKVNGPKREFANGISIYYPIKYNKDEASMYEEVAFSMDYKNFIQGKYEDFENSNDSSTDEYVYDEPYINSDGCYQLNINQDQLDSVKDVYFNLFLQETEESNELIYLGMDNNIYSDFENGIFTDAFEGSWTALNGVYVNLNIIETNDQYNIYSIPIYLNGNETNLRAAWIWDDPDSGDGYGHYEIIGTWDGISQGGLSSRDVKPLSNGDVIEPIYTTYDMETDELLEYTGDEVVVDDSLSLEDTYLPEGIYYFNFEVEDVYGQTSDSEFTAFQIDSDGQIYNLE